MEQSLKRRGVKAKQIGIQDSELDEEERRKNGKAKNGEENPESGSRMRKNGGRMGRCSFQYL
ncbi:hypothetical protein KY290_029371 [Solanum tuberosum]|uniref:Uncharacterized protein n=1 Tax=Solanum tuberosum TaxID=4113 RepID=A0ABQ7UKX1_SOLTU|nr:hypothetical protein KY290_029371 [Solanum tuberosum]